MSIDKGSSTWDAIQEYAKKQIDASHQMLEMRDLDQVETQFERGRIRALRDLLALVEPRPVIPSTDAAYS